MRSSANLLKFAFLTLTLATGSALGDCTSNEYVPGIGCDSSTNICEITCPEEGDCVPSPAQGCSDALVVDTITHSDMDKAKCQELCELSDALEEEAKRCRFWRYVSFLYFTKIFNIKTSGVGQQSRGGVLIDELQPVHSSRGLHSTILLHWRCRMCKWRDTGPWKWSWMRCTNDFQRWAWFHPLGMCQRSC